MGGWIGWKPGPTALSSAGGGCPWGSSPSSTRPGQNVTVDAAALCLKSGNAALLRGGKEALHSNLALGQVMAEALKTHGFPAGCVQVVEDASRQSAQTMMGLTEDLDVLIAPGAAGGLSGR